MSNERLYQVLRAPIVSEKTSRIQEQSNQFVFEVASTATKLDVKRAVEELFKVNVTAVNVVNVKGKTKAFRGRLGVRGALRKAYISLQKGQSIDVVAKP
ncbi:MAG: 50S ribosomal protein L23 [Pseudomonadota bacterium]|nr:50S ribosomal protein L23 [Pseudomonadota bacterium]